jgi:hypothetical protein
VLDAIETSDHPVDAQGEGAIARLRNAVASHRTLGYNPNLAVVSPETAADLDLTAFDSGYQFPLQRYGSSSPLFSLTVVENPNVDDDAILLDTGAVGTLCLGNAKVDVDQSAGFTKNLSTLRVELSVLFVLRSPQAIFEVGVCS